MKSPREVLIDAAGNAAVNCGRALNGHPVVWQEFLKLADAAITARDAGHQEVAARWLESFRSVPGSVLAVHMRDGTWRADLAREDEAAASRKRRP